MFWYALLCALSSFAIILKRKRAGCFAFIVLRMSCYCKCSVAIPRGTMGWSAVCNCCISNHTHLHFTGQKRLKKHCSKHFPRPCGKKRAQITRDSFSLVEAFALNLKKVWLSLITRLDFDPPCNFFCHLQIFIPTLLFPIFQRIFSN